MQARRSGWYWPLGLAVFATTLVSVISISLIVGFVWLWGDARSVVFWSSEGMVALALFPAVGLTARCLRINTVASVALAVLLLAPVVVLTYAFLVFVILGCPCTYGD
jgi:hypothetical protein